MKTVCLWLMLLCLPLGLAAQQEPPGQNWKKIDTLHYEIVFPFVLTQEAQRVANTLEHLYGVIGRTLEQEPSRISLLLSNQGVVANGYVSLAPRMSEWYSRPMVSPEWGVAEWYTLLALHEGRHIVQFDRIRRGFTALASTLFGQAGWAALSMWSVPLWLLEGDAIITETALSRGGRGRQPAFDMAIRSLLLCGRRPSYPQAYLGSYKDYYPSWYHLGFQLTSHLRKHHGPLIPGRVMGQAARRPLSLNPFQGALKDLTGLSLVKLYTEAMNELQTGWSLGTDEVRLSPFRLLSAPVTRGWTAYTHPRYLDDGRVIVQKVGLDQPLSLVTLDRHGQERFVARFNPLDHHQNRLSHARGSLIWSENLPDPRWGKRSYASLVLYDVDKKKLRRLTHETRFFHPALSPDGSRIAAVEFSTDRQCTLVILDALDGHEIRRFANPEGDEIWQPDWSADGGSLVFLRQNLNGRTLTVLDLFSESPRDLFPLAWENLTQPVFWGEYVLYQSPRSGIDNIWAVHAVTRQVYQVTSSRFGAFFPEPSPDGKRLLYCDYGADGYAVVESDLRISDWISAEEVASDPFDRHEHLVEQEQGGSVIDPSGLPQRVYPVSDYRPLSRLIHLHAWTPEFDSPELKFKLRSDDLLSLLSLSAGPVYNHNEKRFGFELSGQYRGLYPMIDLNLGYRGRATTLIDAEGRTERDGWREGSASLGLQLPLNLSRGVSRMSLNLGVRFGLTRVDGRLAWPRFDMGNGFFVPLDYSLSFSRVGPSAARDLRPPWGQGLFVNYSHTPLGGDTRGERLSTRVTLLFPGPLRHDSLMLRLGHERQNPRPYIFGTYLQFPRAYPAYYFPRITTFSLDYALPLAHPDLALGNLLYIKRIKANLFVDLARGEWNQVQNHFSSFGLDLLFDFHILGLKNPQIESGLRLAFAPETRSLSVEWLLAGLGF
jgi:hypothetical protein